MIFHGRGATINPRGRFERLEVALDEEFEAEARNPDTRYLRDDSQSLMAQRLQSAWDRKSAAGDDLVVT